MLLAETQLTLIDSSNDYLIENFETPYRNDQICSTPSRPPHGMISYTKSNARCLEKHRWTDKHF